MFSPRGGHEQHFSKNAAQQSATTISTSKAQRKMRNLVFYFLKSSATSATKVFIQLKRNANVAVTELEFRTKSKRNLSFAIKYAKHGANSSFFAI